jgi:transcriptional regulator with XRE-family HTH domain
MDRAHFLKNFGSAVRHHRARLGISQEELASRAGLDRTYIGGVERGERNASLLAVARIAHALSTSLGELLNGTDKD